MSWQMGPAESRMNVIQVGKNTVTLIHADIRNCGDFHKYVGGKEYGTVIIPLCIDVDRHYYKH